MVAFCIRFPKFLWVLLTLVVLLAPSRVIAHGPGGGGHSHSPSEQGASGAASPNSVPPPQAPAANPTAAQPAVPAPVSTSIMTPTVGLPAIATADPNIGRPAASSAAVSSSSTSAGWSLHRASEGEFVGVTGAVLVGLLGYFGGF
ncbi:hypothetical protein HK102_003550 [Quaeritorhiza haematococci]|nr:hypothetical protein HK102_003550 [Quaeritorhiza haematococci]